MRKKDLIAKIADVEIDVHSMTAVGYIDNPEEVSLAEIELYFLLKGYTAYDIELNENLFNCKLML